MIGLLGQKEFIKMKANDEKKTNRLYKLDVF